MYAMNEFKSNHKRYINLGCGERFHPAWTNVDIHPRGVSVQQWDFLKELPFPAESFDFVYHSHVIEHMPREKGLNFLRQCHRILRSGGTIRVVVPDLEQIVRLYLLAMEKASAGDSGWKAKYDWMLLELYDQTMREFSGGEMSQFVATAEKEELSFVRERIGGELLRMRKSGNPAARVRPSTGERLLFLRLRIRNGLARMVLSENDFRALQIGKFRLCGEIHKWMYDRYSLSRALVGTGFLNPRRVEAVESAIPDWAGFHLDTEPDGSVYKPDSLFVEATRA